MAYCKRMGEVDHAKLREIVFSDTTEHKQLNRFVFFFFLFALLFSLNFEPAFKASCFGHANKEFPFSCQVRLISLLNQKASRTQCC